MRIRSTKPEFWRSKTITAIQWEVIFDGPIPSGDKPYVGLAPEGANHEYVYMFFDAADQLLYVGRSWRPADRFTKHRRKAWWAVATGLLIIRVDGDDPASSSRDTRIFEAHAIRDLAPVGNLAPASKMWLVA